MKKNRIEVLSSKFFELGRRNLKLFPPLKKVPKRNRVGITTQIIFINNDMLSELMKHVSLQNVICVVGKSQSDWDYFFENTLKIKRLEVIDARRTPWENGIRIPDAKIRIYDNDEDCPDDPDYRPETIHINRRDFIITESGDLFVVVGLYEKAMFPELY